MSLISAANFNKQKVQALSRLLREFFSQDGIKIQTSYFLIRAPGKTKVYVEVGVEDSSGVVYLTAGDNLILDSRLKPILEGKMDFDLLGKVIFLNEFKAFLNHPNNLLYTLTSLVAINSTNLKNKTILDLGCAEGILGLVAIKKGASQIFGIDLNDKLVDDFKKNLSINGVPESKSNLLTASFNNQELILKNIPVDRIDVVFVNIGPHFGPSDLDALSLLEFLFNVKLVVGGGYNQSQEHLRPTRALIRMGNFGFKNRLRYFIPENNSHLSFIIER